MKILIIGAGVIGTIYGQALAEAGHQVTHCVRKGKAAGYAGGVTLHLLDGRAEAREDRTIHYPMRTVEQFGPNDRYDLILVSVRHYQLESVLPLLAAFAGQTDILFFNSLWSDFSPIDRCLPRKQYLWGYPVAGGAIDGATLNGALLGEVRLGEIDGVHSERLERLIAMFESARLKVDVSADILGWLWTHFAQEAAVIGVGFKMGSADRLMNHVGALHEVILCMRETFKICAARGVDMTKYQQDFAMFYQPAWLGAVAFRLFFRSHPLEKRIMTAHTGEEELKRIYHDVLSEGKRLGVDMAHFAALAAHVDAYHKITAVVA
jgi:2-dehydropantoate 2-reductase